MKPLPFKSPWKLIISLLLAASLATASLHWFTKYRRHRKISQQVEKDLQSSSIGETNRRTILEMTVKACSTLSHDELNRYLDLKNKPLKDMSDVEQQQRLELELKIRQSLSSREAESLHRARMAANLGEDIPAP